jgi:hypothetical protein
VLSERITPARLTVGTGAGYWLTPRASDTGKGEKSETFVARMGDRTENCFQGLAAQVCHGMWPTPTLAPDAPNTNANRKCGPNSLTECARIGSPLWQTPVKSDCTNRRESKNWKGNDLCSRVNKITFPTPTKSDGTGGPGNSPGRGGDNLRTAVQGSLNPDWVCWLMGWPIGWTNIEREHSEYIDWREDPADIGKVPRVCTGMKHRAARIKAIGNGQCPQAMVLAWYILKGAHHV